MSIIIPEKEINIEISYSSHLDPHPKTMEKQAHINSRNQRRSNSLSNSNSQYSTKEGTPNKEGNVECKTMEAKNLNIELKNVSSATSKDKLSNITQLLNQNNYNYSNVRDKIPSNQNDSNQFVYNMIFTTNNNTNTNSIRTDEISKRLNDLKKPHPNKIDNAFDNNTNTNTKNRNICIKRQSNNHKVHNKEKISCCCFFNK